MLADVKSVPVRELPTTDAWRDAVRARMKALGIRQKDLSVWIGAGESNSAMSYLLDEENPLASSKWVERVSAALRIKLPVIARFRLLTEEMVQLDDESGLEAFVLLMEDRVESKRKRPQK